MKKYFMLFLTITAVLCAFSQDNDTLMDYSMKLIRNQQFAKAIPYLEKYSGNHHNHLNSRLQLAFCYRQTNNLNKSISLYQDIIAQRPEYDRAYYMLANAFMEKGNLDKANDLGKKLLRFDDENPDYLLINAQILREKGDLKQSCKYYKKAKRSGSNEAKHSYKKYCK